MDSVQGIISSTTFLVGVIGCLSLALIIVYFRLIIVTAERNVALISAEDRSAEMREATHQLQQMLAAIHAQVWLLDTQTRVVEFNQITAQFLGTDPLQARGRLMMAILPQWQEPEKAQARNEQVILTGEALIGAIESYEHAGEMHWVSVDRLPSFDAQGNLDGLHLILYDITPLKKVEKALRLQKTILEAQSETSLDAIVVMSPQNQCISYNQRFRELWNLPEEIMVADCGKKAFAHMGEQLRDPQVLNQWLTTFHNVPTMQASNLLRLADGRILDWYSAPVMEDDAQHHGRVWYFRDVTITRKTEQALRDSEARNRALINSIPDMLFRVHRDGTFLDYQGAAGYSPTIQPERFLNRNVTEIFDTETAKRLLDKLQVALATNKLQIHEYEMPMLNGEMRNWEQRIVANGNDEILLIVRDISARKQAEVALKNAHSELEQRVNERTAELQQANQQLQQEIEERYRVEEALRSSEERLELALLGADLGLIDIDLQTGKTVYNERWAEIRGYPLDQFFDTMLTWKSSIHPDDRPAVTLALESHLTGQTSFFEHEYRVKRSDGKWRWVRCRGKIVNRNEHGQPLRFSGTQMDITEYKQLEQQLLHVQKMDAVGRLAGGVAHDFNNILTVIMSYSELVLLQVNGDKRLRSRVEEIKKAAEKATRLTRQLLMFSRCETVAPRVIDMNRLVVDIEAMLERLIGEHITLNIYLDPTIHAVKADAAQLEQVLLNLVVNGRDAMPDGGLIDVSTRCVEYHRRQSLPHPEMHPGIYTELAVRDTGCGMTPEVQKRIFEPFFTTKGAGKGTGLGLSTVFGIVNQNHGFIDVQSEVNEGSNFRILFPAVFEPESESAKPVVPSLAHGYGIETILLVEDEAQIRSLLGSALQDAGYTVLVASNGEEALEISQRHDGLIHLMVTDVVMPGVSGTALAEKLTTQRPTTKIIFISGYTDGEINMHNMLDGDRLFLRKPFTPAILINVVRQLLDGVNIPL